VTLHYYFANRFLISVLGVFGIFAGLIWLVDMIEYLRRFSEQEFDLGDAARLAILNLPDLIYGIIPLIVLLATIMMFVRLSRTSELIVTRAAGRSALRSLIAPLVMAVVLGGIGITVFNPIVAATSQQFEQRIAAHEGGERSVLSISAEGLWLRQRDGTGQMVIRASEASLGGTALFDVMFLSFDASGTPQYRLDAAKAELVPGAWEIVDARRWNLKEDRDPASSGQHHDALVLASSLTLEQIKDSFATPSSIPIWELPSFIDQLEEAGFAANRHRVWLHVELATPIFLVCMVLTGAAFTMRHTRFGRTGLMVLMAVLLGFGLFFMRSFAQVLGETGSIPVLVAAWAPPFAGICLTLAVLLHQEDG